MVNFKEFCSGLSVVLKGTPEERYELCFEIYDTDKTGAVTKEEMRQVMGAYNYE